MIKIMAMIMVTDIILKLKLTSEGTRAVFNIPKSFIEQGLLTRGIKYRLHITDCGAAFDPNAECTDCPNDLCMARAKHQPRGEECYASFNEDCPDKAIIDAQEQEWKEQYPEEV